MPSHQTKKRVLDAVEYKSSMAYQSEIIEAVLQGFMEYHKEIVKLLLNIICLVPDDSHTKRGKNLVTKHPSLKMGQ